jgi:hypothetical protein
MTEPSRRTPAASRGGLGRLGARIGGLVALLAGVAAAAVSTPNYYAGGNLSLNLRSAFYDFDAAGLSQDTVRAPALLTGFNLGRRYVICPWLRVQLGAIFDFGRLPLDTLQSKYIQSLSVFHLGFEPELQVGVPVKGVMAPYLLLGGGLNYFRVHEQFHMLDNPRQPVQFSDLKALVAKRWCPSGFAGFGGDLRFSRDWGLSPSLVVRYWRPVAYGYSTDLFDAVTYRETLLSFTVRLQLIFRFETDR